MKRAASRSFLLLAAAVVAALIGACSDEGTDADPTATAPPATATAVPSATPDPLGAPEADGGRIFEHVRVLSEQPRVAGSPEEIEARDYIQTVLESYGYEVEIQPFQFDSSLYLPASVTVEGLPYPALSLRGSPSGSAAGLLIDAGLGRPEEFPAGGLNGAIALIERGDLTFVAKVENAAAAGASGVIVFNNEEGRLIGDAPGATIPSIGITQADGRAMRARLAAGQVEAALNVPAPTGTAYNIIARPPGIDMCETVTGGHSDSVPVSPGADDNASGSAGVIEVARMAMANGLPGANCFVLFGAEEVGLLGSLHYVEQLSDEEVNAMRAMVNIDVIGTTEQLVLIGSEDLVDLARIEADAIDVDAVPGNVPTGLGSDHASFLDAGIPVVFFYRHDDQIHTRFDAIDRIDAQALEDTVSVAYATLEAIVGAG